MKTTTRRSLGITDSQEHLLAAMLYMGHGRVTGYGARQAASDLATIMNRGPRATGTIATALIGKGLLVRLDCGSVFYELTPAGARMAAKLPPLTGKTR